MKNMKNNSITKLCLVIWYRLSLWIHFHNFGYEFWWCYLNMHVEMHASYNFCDSSLTTIVAPPQQTECHLECLFLKLMLKIGPSMTSILCMHIYVARSADSVCDHPPTRWRQNWSVRTCRTSQSEVHQDHHRPQVPQVSQCFCPGEI